MKLMRTLLSGVHALRLDDPTGYDVILGPTLFACRNVEH
jgi:hypothetical protein